MEGKHSGFSIGITMNILNRLVQCKPLTPIEDTPDVWHEVGFVNTGLVKNLLISENGYVLDTGNWENVNAKVALRLVEKIKKHPILWKHFFMVA